MQDIMSYLLKNKEWIFSGIGVLFLSALLWFFRSALLWSFRRTSQWFSLRANTGKLRAPTVVEHPEIDRAVYKKLQEILPWNGTILFIRQHDFGGSFSWDKLDELDAFCAECLNPNFEFLDPDLERTRTDLLEMIQQFTDILTHNTWPHDTSSVDASRISSVPSEWRRTDRERYTQVTGQLHRLSSQIGECYDSMVKMGRIKLGVEGI